MQCLRVIFAIILGNIQTAVLYLENFDILYKNLIFPPIPFSTDYPKQVSLQELSLDIGIGGKFSLL